ncbi:CheR family methyltransferase [Pararhodospirillum photometricum]|uniref:Chemotaxis protein methyltransferase n=1 Tax=Pararhodospirillum photometricum DSM 122 TaxID=1150469 RepID=H6SP10_PARPM|nr:CheR family methyltransferase [Pararhodospirillum photometricum]CCG07082.1 MCP methyltransferase, CheR-type [Pararhodospirillum photometricum DSM 122]
MSRAPEPGSYLQSLAGDTLPPKVYQTLADLIEEQIGIRLPESKKTLVESRLRRRVRALGLDNLRQYAQEYLETERISEEFADLVNALTTNKTDFYREPSHFDLLVQTVLPAMLRDGLGRTRPLRIWSAACSIGAEPYTLAMVLSDYARLVGGLQFSLRGFDIDSEALFKARRAIYDLAYLGPIPEEARRRYILRARVHGNHTFRIAPEVRRMVEFFPLNLLSPEWPDDQHPDIIFCRNVLIYFNRPNQQRALEGLCERLRPKGVLFVGHSESLHGLSLPVQPLAPATYQRV